MSASSPVSSKETQLNSTPSDGISSLRFSSSETSVLASTSWDCSVRLYNTETNTLLGNQRQRAPVLDAAFQESSKVFAAGLAREIVLHDFGSATASVVGYHEDAVKALEYSDAHRIVVSGSWDRTVKAWDPRKPGAPTALLSAPERVYGLTQAGAHVLVVATAGRRVLLYDLRKMTGTTPGENPLRTAPRESSLKHQTRVVRGFPDGSGYATGSVEGRVAIDFVDDSPGMQAGKYSFKCHRVKSGADEKVFPVHAISFHPTFGTFATGGGDGMVCVWDGAAKKRLCQYRDYGTSVSALAFNRDGSQLAIAASYAYENGPTEAHPPDAIFVRSVADSDVRPKSSLRT